VGKGITISWAPNRCRGTEKCQQCHE